MTTAAPTCPQCGAALQRLSGADGWMVEQCIDPATFRTIDVRRLHAVYACPRCEFTATRERAS